MISRSTRKALIVILLLTLSLSMIAGCALTLVAPYDENLVANTEAFYKKAAGIVEEGRQASPKTDEARSAISKPEEHKGHFSKFEPKYNDLIVDSEALILRAMASSGQIDQAGLKLQEKIERLIETEIPSECIELSEQFGKTSLTAKNYIDLKCIVTKWKAQHANRTLTRDTMILKKANWEGRKHLIFNAILAIQKAEAFKKNNQKQ